MKNNLSESFGTLSQTVDGLKTAGYTLDFNIQDECIICRQTNTTLSPEDFQIDKVYRFEGDSNPDDESIVYAISSPRFGVKGVLVNGYGPTADEASSRLVEKLRTSDAPQKREAPQSSAGDQSAAAMPEATLATMDLDALMAQLKQSPAWAAGKLSSVTVYKADGMRIMLMGLPEGAEIKPHSASGVISVQVLDGSIDFVAGEQKARLRKRQMIALRENITHSVQAVSESFFLLTVAVPRQP